MVWDAGNSFAHLAIQHGLCDDDRAGEKGSEPEGLMVAEYNGVSYAFVASERSSIVSANDENGPPVGWSARSPLTRSTRPSSTRPPSRP